MRDDQILHVAGINETFHQYLLVNRLSILTCSFNLNLCFWSLCFAFLFIKYTCVQCALNLNSGFPDIEFHSQSYFSIEASHRINNYLIQINAGILCHMIIMISRQRLKDIGYSNLYGWFYSVLQIFLWDQFLNSEKEVLKRQKNCWERLVNFYFYKIEIKVSTALLRHLSETPWDNVIHEKNEINYMSSPAIFQF